MTAATRLAALRASDPQGRSAVLAELAAERTALDTATLSAVIDCLAASPKTVQRLAADVLAITTRAEGAATVIEQLRVAAASNDPRLGWGATYALGRLGVYEAAMVRPLLVVFAHGDGDERWAAAELMRACARRHAATAIPALLEAASNGSGEQRKMALYVLRDVAPDDARVRDQTLRGLADAEVGVRFAALSALARLDPRPRDACDLALALAEHDPDPGFRRAAISALGWLGRGVSAVDAALAIASSSDDPSVRRAAAIARRRLAE